MQEGAVKTEGGSEEEEEKAAEEDTSEDAETEKTGLTVEKNEPD